MPAASHEAGAAETAFAATAASSCDRTGVRGWVTRVATKDMENSAETGPAEPLKDAVLIAGPTASGKSALAALVAAREGRAVVNADSMQVYSVLSLLTARPGAAELAAAPHHLYGHVAPDAAYSTGAWLRDVARLPGFREPWGRAPVFVGGTGLYFRALSEGLSPMPAVPAAIRERWRGRLAEEGPARLHAELAGSDARAAETLSPADGQRIVRALEVLEASGRSIRDWQRAKSAPLVDAASARMLILEPEREMLAERIAVRLRAMTEAGALEEVRALRALKLPSQMPAMKAIGVREFGGFLEGECDLAAALETAAAATRRYAKRQATWFRHQKGERWVRLAVGRGDDAAGLYTRAAGAFAEMAAAGEGSSRKSGPG